MLQRGIFSRNWPPAIPDARWWSVYMHFIAPIPPTSYHASGEPLVTQRYNLIKYLHLPNRITVFLFVSPPRYRPFFGYALIKMCISKWGLRCDTIVRFACSHGFIINTEPVHLISRLIDSSDAIPYSDIGRVSLSISRCVFANEIRISPCIVAYNANFIVPQARTIFN